MRSTSNRVGKYELKAVLARTALSTVYDGWDADIARRVAIKLIPLGTVDDDEAREALARFKRGAQAAGKLNHPNIVSVYDYGETEDQAYIVMEFIDGPTLKTLFDNNRKFEILEIGNIVGSILGALQYSHDRRIVHRDIKPANVMFTKNNVVKITDFGIARLEDSEMTQAGMVIGTPAYMSPEQFLGEKIDWRTDIYSTGVLLYHLLTGERPYEGTLATIMHKVLYGTPLLPSRLSTGITPAFDKVVIRAMAKKREDRFESAAEFKAELRKALISPAANADRTVVPRTEVRKLVRQSSGHTPPRTVIFAALTTAVILVGGGLLWYGRSAPLSVPASNGSSDQRKEVDAGRLPATGPVTQVQQPASNNDEATKIMAPAEPRDTFHTELREAAAPVDRRDTVVGYHNDVIEQPRPPLSGTERSDPDPVSAPNVLPPVNSTAYAVLPHPLQIGDASDKKPAADSATTKTPRSDRSAGGVGLDKQTLRPEVRNGKPPFDILSRPRPEPGPNIAKLDDATADALRRLHPGAVGPISPSDASDTLPIPYAATSSSAIGLLCRSVTMETAPSHGLDSARGMIVLGVTAGSAAAMAGIRQDDVILKISGSEVRDLSSLPKVAVDTPAGHPVPVEIVRQGKNQVVQLQVDQLRR
jgi:serine/threonine protein kinase